MVNPTQTRPDRNLIEALRFLDRWYMAASTGGMLWIQARRSRVAFEDCCALLKRLSRVLGSGSYRTAVLDLGMAQIPDDRWPAFLRVVSMIAKRMNARCRVLPSREMLGGEHRETGDASTSSNGIGSIAPTTWQPKPVCIILESVVEEAA
jgi:hypothetical protein